MTTTAIDTKQLFIDLDSTWDEVTSRIQDNSYSINEIPFEGSWTIAQLAEHIIKSNKVITEGMRQHGRPADRDPEAAVPNLKETFLNFERSFSHLILLCQKKEIIYVMK